jgi:hypothetical protein
MVSGKHALRIDLRAVMEGKLSAVSGCQDDERHVLALHKFKMIYSPVT